MGKTVNGESTEGIGFSVLLRKGLFRGHWKASLLIPVLFFFLHSQSYAGSMVHVAVSLPPQAYFVRQIGGQRVTLQVLLPPGANPATYAPKPGELASLLKADIYFRIHVPFEDAWMKRFRAVNRKMLVIDTTEGIEKIGKDPHVWLSPALVKHQARQIAKGLSQVDPAGKRDYMANLDRFNRSIDKLTRTIEKRLRSFKGRTLLVYHPCWGYFAREFGLKQVAIEHEGKPPGAALLAKVIRVAQRDRIHCIFAQPQFDSRSAQIIARQIHGRVVLIDPMAEDWAKNLLRVTDKIVDCLGR
ncbi:MAG: cation ABC transporter substrate-binding protein [Deltaproteobacteria bacterium]|nr:MAG: cation ABC transporter substrate-binding protein [Deltaproteobacteria bacterium]